MSQLTNEIISQFTNTIQYSKIPTTKNKETRPMIFLVVKYWKRHPELGSGSHQMNLKHFGWRSNPKSLW